jgi:hypothetical protein
MVLVEENPPPPGLGFHGSPTVLVDHVDVDETVAAGSSGWG